MNVTLAVGDNEVYSIHDAELLSTDYETTVTLRLEDLTAKGVAFDIEFRKDGRGRLAATFLKYFDGKLASSGSYLD